MRLATRVMRKHRLAERLLTDVIGLDWELVHEEACRWEHVMSETVERRLVELLDHPTESPYGNPIPGLAELGRVHGRRGVHGRRRAAVRRRLPRGGPGAGPADLRGDAEGRAADERAAPGRRAARTRPSPSSPRAEGVLVGSGGETAEIVPEAAEHIFVRKL